MTSRYARELADWWFSDPEYGRVLFRLALGAKSLLHYTLLLRAAYSSRWRINGEFVTGRAGVEKCLEPLDIEDCWVPLDIPPPENDYSDYRSTRRLLSQISSEDLVWLNYRLGLSQLFTDHNLSHEEDCQGLDPALRPVARYLLEWSATFERGGLRNDPRPRTPRAEILALIRYKSYAAPADGRPHAGARHRRRLEVGRNLARCAEGWAIGEALARTCLRYISPPDGARITKGRAQKLARITENLMGQALRRRQLTPERAVLSYAIWYFIVMCVGVRKAPVFNLGGLLTPGCWHSRARAVHFSDEMRGRFRYPQYACISLPCHGRLPDSDSEGDAADLVYKTPMVAYHHY